MIVLKKKLKKREKREEKKKKKDSICVTVVSVVTDVQCIKTFEKVVSDWILTSTAQGHLYGDQTLS